jgi:mRNA interferase ChpB
VSLNRGDIYFADLEPTSGREQQGHRPVLIISPDAFNRKTQLPLILPITSGGNFARAAGFSVQLSGMRTTGIVRCDQPRVLDLASRSARFVERMPDHLVQEVLGKMLLLFS